MRATGVELHWNGGLLTRTVTYDDGHYEFNDLKADYYYLKVVAEGYEDVEYSVVVEPGRIAKGDMQLEKKYTGMTVRTLDITDIGGNSATLGGEFSYDSYYSGFPDECGFVYATHTNPVNGGTRITASLWGNFTATITNLSKATYYVRAYAKNFIGTEYGEERSFQVTGLPSITTLPATNVTVNAATLNGKIEYQGDPAFSERGFVYSYTFQNPTLESDATTKSIVSGTGTDFSINVSGLTTDKAYHVRAYAINDNGTVYGAQVNFETSNHPNAVVLPTSKLMVQKTDINNNTVTWSTGNSLCGNSTLDGYTDWRLPTKDELAVMYNERNTIGGFKNGQYDWYWSSTVHSTSGSSTYYWVQNFGSGAQDSTKYYSTTYTRCRCVRNY
jgi:hypothetical protein